MDRDRSRARLESKRNLVCRFFRNIIVTLLFIGFFLKGNYDISIIIVPMYMPNHLKQRAQLVELVNVKWRWDHPHFSQYLTHCNSESLLNSM